MKPIVCVSGVAFAALLWPTPIIHAAPLRLAGEIRSGREEPLVAGPTNQITVREQRSRLMAADTSTADEVVNGEKLDARGGSESSIGINSSAISRLLRIEIPFNPDDFAAGRHSASGSPASVNNYPLRPASPSSTPHFWSKVETELGLNEPSEISINRQFKSTPASPDGENEFYYELVRELAKGDEVKTPAPPRSSSSTSSSVDSSWPPFNGARKRKSKDKSSEAGASSKPSTPKDSFNVKDYFNAPSWKAKSHGELP